MSEYEKSGVGLIEGLTNALRCLPGVGPKSAQRMTYHLLERNRDGARALSNVLHEAMDRVGNCTVCRTLTEGDVCRICMNSTRDRATLCVVESPTDMAAIEHGTDYRGMYFVLMGNLSPLDGIGPDELGLETLSERLREGEVRELILATGATVEGEATAHYVSELAREANVRASRIAQGVPLGGELEFVDSSTLAHALTGRHEVK
jgi:recombination protein RecR